MVSEPLGIPRLFPQARARLRADSSAKVVHFPLHITQFTRIGSNIRPTEFQPTEAVSKLQEGGYHFGIPTTIKNSAHD
jgi:hypothetical protein